MKATGDRRCYGVLFSSEFPPSHCWRWRQCEVTRRGRKEAGLWVRGSRNEVSLFLPGAFGLLRHISPGCVSSVSGGLQSKSGGQFRYGRLLRDGDGFKRRSHQNVEAPSKRGTPDCLSGGLVSTSKFKCSLEWKPAKEKNCMVCLVVFFYQAASNLMLVV